MIFNERIKKVLFGGDYNPEQWPEEIWQEDMRLFRLAHIDTVTLNVFSWATLQKDDDVWDFSKLDKIMDLVKENHLHVCLATSTGAHPAWMARKYPEILRVDPTGIRRKFGSRHNSCPNSPIYQKYSTMLAGKLAARYRSYDTIFSWHISNEYGGMCYCDKCEAAFRLWLKKRYQTLDEVNRVWNTAFWGHTLYDWEDIVVPDFRSEEFMWGDSLRTNFQGISLDYKRFMSESMQKCYKMEYDAIKKEMPNIPITTNLMGAYKGLDYHQWAKDMDFISWDNYPTYDAKPWESAFMHDLMRGLKQGKPFALMEQTPSVSNWHPYCALKRPGVMRLYSMQAAAHGADTIMFFQMRRSIGACEKYHSALIDHRGNEHTRVFSEMTALGEELVTLQDQTLGGRTHSEAAIVFDWDNWWAAELSAGPTALLDYVKEIKTWYRYFWENHISVDIISVEDDLSSYKMVAAPLLHMCKDGFSEKLTSWVAKGGCFLTTYFSGYVEDHDLVITGGYPGRLKELLGIWVEETDARVPGSPCSFSYDGKSYPGEILCDLLHTEGAQSLGSYEEDFYQGMPAVTRNTFQNGTTYYVATHSTPEFYQHFLDNVCREQHITPIGKADGQVEITLRQNTYGKQYYLLNHQDQESHVILPEAVTCLLTGETFSAGEPIVLAPKDVRILKHSIS